MICEKYHFSSLDTGSYFRALAFLIHDKGIPDYAISDCLKECEKITYEHMKNPKIREENIAQLASRLSVHPEIRERFRRFCRALAARLLQLNQGLVVDGRDAGTVLFPEAPVKFFLLVRPEERARRRYNEYKEMGCSVSYEFVYKSILERDRRDQNRASDPLRPAMDAHILDVSDMTKDQVLEIASKYLDQFFTKKKEIEKC
jgi:cytidylate kinase